MLQNLRAALLVPDIRKRIIFVFGAFALFVFMIHVQLPDVDERRWQELLRGGTFYNFLGFLTGGALQHLSIIAMGITPYINASIIMQLMTVVIPQLEELAKKGGEEGRRKISQYTRWLTIVLAIVQASTMSINMQRQGVFYDQSWMFLVYAIIAFVSGTLFLMWLGEQISDKGIGNGVSLIIFIGIVLRYPSQALQTIQLGQKQGLNVFGLFLFIVIALITIISIIFAISILLLPQQAIGWFGHSLVAPTYATLGPIGIPTNMAAVAAVLELYFSTSSPLYNLAYFILVVMFTFFYSSIVVNIKDIADNLKKSGSFIPGIRPGGPTEEYIRRILFRITTVAAIYLGLLAVLPSTLQRGLGVTTVYLGSTSLLIVVGVALDTMTQIEARLAMRDYKGFMKR